MSLRRKLCLLPVGMLCSACTPRRRQVAGCVLACGFIFTVLILSIGIDNMPREELMEIKITEVQEQLSYLQSLYSIRNVELINIQNKLSNLTIPLEDPKVTALKQKYQGTKVAEGFDPKNLQALQIPILPHVMTHISKDLNTLRPSFRIPSTKGIVNFVIGIPTVKRDKAVYWLNTLKSLVQQMSDSDRQDTLIIIFVGETDVSYVAEVAKDIEEAFPDLLGDVVEVLSAAAGYYPDLDSMPQTLGDSPKRFKWRTKQNLDAIYLMGYAHTKGIYYLMLEDDVETKPRFMEKMRIYIRQVSITNSDWFMLDFCRDGGIGKLFRSTDLLHFITYVQLFYYNMPIDWLLENYVNTKVCPPSRDVKCGALVREIRLQHKEILFIHKGTYSSLKGKVHVPRTKVKAALFFPHSNPPVAELKTSLKYHEGHSLAKAYNGTDFFWGAAPAFGDYIEFIFQQPLYIDRFTFRSSNLEHTADKFYHASVQALVSNGTYVDLANFDEFGLAEGEVFDSLGPITSLRLLATNNSSKWVILSEIEIVTKEPKPFAHTRQAST